MHLPIGAEKTFRGVVDLITMKALIYTPDGDGRPKVEEIPADLAEAAKKAHETLVEMVAEGDDKLMEEFFEKGTLPVEDLMKGLRDGVPGAAHLPGHGELGAAQYRQRRSSICWRKCFRIPPRAAGQRHSETASKGSGLSAKSATPSRCPFLCSRHSPIPSPGGSAISR